MASKKKQTLQNTSFLNMFYIFQICGCGGGNNGRFCSYNLKPDLQGGINYLVHLFNSRY